MNSPVTQLRDEHKKKLEEFESTYKKNKDKITTLVKDYPLTSVAIAAFVGILIGRLLKSRK
jgi:ElaB/YqjD/DUF883 family membrane-anchored ribosome-binding protein